LLKQIDSFRFFLRKGISQICVHTAESSCLSRPFHQGEDFRIARRKFESIVQDLEASLEIPIPVQRPGPLQEAGDVEGFRIQFSFGRASTRFSDLFFVFQVSSGVLVQRWGDITVWLSQLVRGLRHAGRTFKGPLLAG
jgi:hypothetical protein